VPRPAEALARVAEFGARLPVGGFVRMRWPGADEAPRTAAAGPGRAAPPAAAFLGALPATAGDALPAGPAAGAGEPSAPIVRAEPPSLPSPPDDPELARNLARARELGARDVPVEDPCLDPACGLRALDAFHLALGRAGSGSGLARVVHFGDSTISSDLIAGTVRERLQAAFGDGGRGYLFVDGPTRYRGQLRRAGKASPGWDIRSLAGPFADDGRYGMGGASFEARGAGERVAFAPRGSDSVDLHYLGRPGGGRLEVFADGAALGVVDTAAPEPRVQFARFQVPEATETVRVVTDGPARLFGAVLERDGGGVVYDTLGVPGSSAGQLLSMHEGDLAAALRRRRPDLLVVMLGMNESHSLRDDPAALAGFEARERAMLARLRRAAPGASCLVTSPMDGARRDGSGEARSKAVLPKLRDLQRRAAVEAGCAFWDMFEAMGGAGSMGRWEAAGLALPDLSHPTDDGGPVLGTLLGDALLASHRAWQSRGPAEAPVAELPGAGPGLESPGALRGYFAALAAVEAGESGAAAPAVQLGDSHTAADKFPSQLRRRLAASFGSAGRGLVFPGAPFRTPAPEDVVTAADGFVTVEGLTGTAPPTFGAAGLLAAAAFAGDSVEVGTPDAGPFARVSAFELHYLVDPLRGGTALLRLDDLPAGLLDTRLPGEAPDGSPLGITRLEVFPGHHRLAVWTTGDGEVALLGAVLESNRPGATWEALGLSGAVAATPLAWDVALFHAQLARRHPRLVALAYGTNEAVGARFDAAAYRDRFGRLVARVRDVAREASCLVIGPPDVLVDDGAGRLGPSPHLDRIVAVQREVALADGCAFWDARAAMGGAGTMARWMAGGLGYRDGVHFWPAGYRRLGDLLFEDLLAAYRRRGEDR
jgi:lysophospholipase L1-like esterase